MLGFYIICQSVSALPLRPVAHLDQLRDLLLLTDGELTNAAQRLHNLRFGRWCWGMFLRGEYQAIWHHPHLQRRSRLNSRIIQPASLQGDERGLVVALPLTDITHGITAENNSLADIAQAQPEGKTLEQ